MKLNFLRLATAVTTAAILASTVVALGNDKGSESWETSTLTRFGVSISHPASLRRLKAAWEEPGFQGSISALNVDTLSDGKMTVTLEGFVAFQRGVFNNRWADELSRYGSQIHYKVKRNSWFVVSGVKPNGMEFYTKVWLLKGDQGFSFTATYPHALNSTYDMVLERMLGNFMPVFTDG